MLLYKNFRKCFNAGQLLCCQGWARSLARISGLVHHRRSDFLSVGFARLTPLFSLCSTDIMHVKIFHPNHTFLRSEGFEQRSDWRPALPPFYR